jgi:hypothetical protein
MSESDGGGESVDVSKGVVINGSHFYPLLRPVGMNPCAGRNDGTPCGPGCVCRGGQCYYSLQRLRKMGFAVPER